MLLPHTPGSGLGSELGLGKDLSHAHQSFELHFLMYILLVQTLAVRDASDVSTVRLSQRGDELLSAGTHTQEKHTEFKVRAIFSQPR